MKKKNRNILLFLIVFVGTIAIRRFGVETPHINMLNLILMIAFTYLMVYIHEIGHVLAARSVGIGVSRVQFGNGREIIRKKFFGILWIFKNRIGGGYTYVGELKNRFSKPAYAFFIAGGLLFQAIITLLAVAISGFRFKDFIGNHELNIVSSFIMANIYMIALTIIPMKITFREINIPNDGLNILKLPFAKEKDINAILSAGKIMEAFELYESKKYHDAQVAFEQCIVDFPDSIVAKIDYSTSILKQGRILDAEKILHEIFDSSHDKRYDLILFNNIAWINLLKFNTESLQVAKDFSFKAIQLNPNVSFIRGTRASTLIACGEIDEGINIIRGDVKTGKPIDTETNSLVGFIMLGFAYLKKKETKKAETYLSKFIGNINRLDEDEKILVEKLKENSGEFKNALFTLGEEKLLPETAFNNGKPPCQL